MPHALPRRPPIESVEDEPTVVTIDGESGEAVRALQSRVARDLLDALYDEPGAASDLADRAETSLQNAQYHLGRLREAGLVTVAGRWYSEKGVEMDVYAPTGRPLVLVAGSEERLGALQTALGGDDPEGVRAAPGPAQET